MIGKFLYMAAAFFACTQLYAQSYGTFTQYSQKPQAKQMGYDSIVAIVEDKVITNAQLAKEMAPFLSRLKASARTQYEYEKNYESLKNEILNNLVNKILIVKNFREKGMQIPKSYLDSHFDEYIKSEFHGDRNEFLKYIQNEGKTVKQFRQEQEEDIIVDYMQSQQRRSVSEISPAKILEYYKANKSKWFEPESVNLKQITLSASDGELAKTIVKEAKEKNNFEDLAKKFSKDKNTAKKGGDWGWYKKGELVPQLDTAAFALQKGQVSDPVLIGDTIFILKQADHRKEGVQDLDSVREQIEWALVGQNATKAYKKWVEKLRKDAYIKFEQ